MADFVRPDDGASSRDGDIVASASTDGSRENLRRAKRGVSVGVVAVALVALAVVLVLVGLLVGLVLEGTHALVTAPVTTRLRAGLVATVEVTLLTVLFATPLGVAVAAWRTRFARSPRLASTLGFALDALGTIPGVVYGVAGALTLVLVLHRGASLVAGAVVLAAMSVPVAAVRAEEALRGVPRALEEASMALGASRADTFFRVTLPMAARGVGAGALRVAARAMAAGAPLVFTAGVGDKTALTVQVWRALGEGSATGQAMAAVAALVLVAMTTVATVLAQALRG